MNRVIMSLFFSFAIFSQTSFAKQTINDLVNQGKLNIALDVVQNEQQIVGQALIISIEVATDRWFAKGTSVQSFTLANVVMQANNIATINGTKRIKGQTWAMQTHEITIYPTLAGKYTLPALNIDVSVNTEDNGIVSGVLSTPEADINITLPTELIGIDSFIVSPKVTLNINGQFDADKTYAVGEALTQTITITASDTPAMMIPEINLTSINEVTNVKEPNKATLDGISIYHKPAQIFDKANRGSLVGSRVESTTYIFEKPGHYILPERMIYWWNSQTNIREELLIPSSSWTVSGGGVSKQNNSNIKLGDIQLNLEIIAAVLLSFLVLALAYILFLKRQLLINFYIKTTHYEQRQLRQQFLSSIAKKEYLLASQYLYQYALTSDKYAVVENWPLSKQLNKLAFQAESEQQGLLSFPISDAKMLIQQIDSELNKKRKTAHFSPNKAIKLNEE